jgi:hypothetical protein
VLIFIIPYNTMGRSHLKIKKKRIGNQFYGFQFDVPLHLLVTIFLYPTFFPPKMKERAA